MPFPIQAVVVDRPVYDEFLGALAKLGAHITTPEQTKLLEQLVIKDGVTNTTVVGLAAAQLAQMAGFKVPPQTPVLLSPYTGVGKDFPLSREKLCPILALYVVDGHEEGCQMCLRILDQGGRGHTLGLHAKDEAIIRSFALEKPVNRIILNGPTSLGAVGFSTHLFPSMTLGCGSFGGNITSDNIGPQHLVNIKRLARLREGWKETSLDAQEAEAGTRGVPVGSEVAPGALAENSGGSPLSKGPHNPDHLNAMVDQALKRLRAAGVSRGSSTREYGRKSNP
jgi:hypothetical protein